MIFFFLSRALLCVPCFINMGRGGVSGRMGQRWRGAQPCLSRSSEPTQKEVQVTEPDVEGYTRTFAIFFSP